MDTLGLENTEDWTGPKKLAPWDESLTGFQYIGDAIDSQLATAKITFSGEVQYSALGTSALVITEGSAFCKIDNVGGPVPTVPTGLTAKVRHFTVELSDIYCRSASLTALFCFVAQVECCRLNEACSQILDQECDAACPDTAAFNASSCNYVFHETWDVMPGEPLCAGNKVVLKPFVTTVPGDIMTESVCFQTITIQDTEAPVLKYPTSPKPVQTLEACPTTPYTFEAPEFTVSDDCDKFANATCEKNRKLGRCHPEYTEIITVTATDECGNSKCDTFTYLVRDDQKPEIDETNLLPHLGAFECTGPTMDQDFPYLEPTASDACAKAGSSECALMLSSPPAKKHQGSCANTYQKIKTWTATDCCGNVDVVHRTLVVVDTTAPSLVLEPHETEYKCNETAVTAVPVAFDVCAQKNFTANQVNGSIEDDPMSKCPQDKIQVISYDVCDDCGNKNTTSYTIHYRLKTDPEWTEFPSDKTYNCTDVIPEDTPKAVLPCFGFVNISYSDVITGTFCWHEFADDFGSH